MRKLQFEDPVGVNIKMSNELLQLLRKEAFDNAVPVSEMIRRILKEHYS